MTIVAFDVFEFFRVKGVNRPFMLNNEVTYIYFITFVIINWLSFFIADKRLLRIFNTFGINSVFDDIFLYALRLFMSHFSAFVAPYLFTVTLRQSQGILWSVKFRTIFGPMPGVSTSEARLYVPIVLVLYLYHSLHLHDTVLLVVPLFIAYFAPGSPFLIAHREYWIWHVTVLFFVPGDLTFRA